MVSYKKVVSVVIPTYNEIENVREIYHATKLVLEATKCRWKILFVDNCSVDGTADVLQELAIADKSVQVIFNRRNFGTIRSPLHGFLQAQGDAVIIMSADFQDPPELIRDFVDSWLDGEKFVCAVKRSSKDSFFMRWMRLTYYFLQRKMSEYHTVPNFYGYGLYDREIVELVRSVPGDAVFIRTLPFEFGYKPKQILFDQPSRQRGLSRHSITNLIEVAVFGLIEQSYFLDKIFFFVGAGCSLLSLIAAAFFLIVKILFWSSLPIGVAPTLIALFFLFGINFCLLGVICSYVNASLRLQKSLPLVVERTRLNI